jgi:hypothetical protein
VSDITWKLSDGGRLLEIFRSDPRTRKLSLFLPLRATRPMTEADAQKYIDQNFPQRGSAVRLAAETLSSKRRCS